MGKCQLDDLAGGCSGGLGSRAAFLLLSDAEDVWEKEPPLPAPHELDHLEHCIVAHAEQKSEFLKYNYFGLFLVHQMISGCWVCLSS